MIQSKRISQKLAVAAARLALEHPKHAHLFSPERRLTPDGKTKCCIVTCDRPVTGKGLCVGHYARWKYKCELNPDIPLDKAQNHKGALNGNWKGGEISDGHGRILIYAPKHPNPSYCGTHVYRYRLVMEKYLGRFLLPSEIVHHKNEDQSDDRIENLEVMTQAKHCKLHLHPTQR